MEFEDLLSAVGNYGKYQKRLVYFFLVPIAITLPFFCLNLIFMLSTPPHGCYQPDVSAAMDLTAADKLALVRPWITGPGNSRIQSGCDMYSLNYSEVLETLTLQGSNVTDYVSRYSPTWKTEPCRQGWQYDKSLYRRTITTQWNLVCGNNYLPSLVYTMSNAGSAIGTPVFGSLSDKIGRKISFLASCVIAVATGVATVTVPSFVAFIVVRSINGGIFPSIFQLPYLILVEIVSPEMRTRMNGIACMGWTVGLAIMPLLAWLTADWLSFGWICAAAAVPYLAYYWFLPESPRWLMSQDRFDETSQILRKMADVNGKDISSLDLVALFKKFNVQDRMQTKGGNISPLELFRNPTIRTRFICVAMSWIADAMTYYGFHISVSTLAGNEFLNFFLLALVELPSYIFCWFLMGTRMGRRWSNAFFLFLTSFACILPIMVPEDWTTFTTVAALVGKFGVSGSFMVMYQQAAEVFPTPLRASGMGLAGTLASIVSICTPYVIYLGMYGRHIPFTFMGCVSLAAGVASTFLPETLNENLPQTIQDGEDFGKGRPFFSFAKTTLKDAPKKDLNELSMESATALGDSNRTNDKL